MIGSQQIEISAKDLVKGMSSGANITDGGFSSDTDGVNLTNDVGVLYAPAAMVDKSTNLADNIIASADDPNYNGYGSLFLDDSGNFYTCDSSSFALTKVATASSDKFSQGCSDFVFWNGNWYATTKAGAGGDIVKVTPAWALTENWWTSTLSQSALSNATAWRPQLVYETNLYIGDKNLLHRIDISNVVSNSILNLGTFEVISALGIDKNTGLMLIATTGGVDWSATRNSKSKIYLYDGLSQKPSRVIPINGTVTAFKNIDDRTVVFVGNKVGYWTGNGIKYVRKMNFSLGDSTKLVYPHRATVIENTCYWSENSKIIAFGDVIPGTKVIYPAVSNSVNSNDFTSVQHVGGGRLGLSFGNNTPANAKFYTFDTTDVSTNNGMTLYSHKYQFPKPAFLRDACIEYSDAVPNNDDNRAIYFKTSRQQDGWKQLARHSGTSLKNESGDDEYEIDEIQGLGDKPVKTVQLKYTTVTTNIGVRRIVLTYDYAK